MERSWCMEVLTQHVFVAALHLITIPRSYRCFQKHKADCCSDLEMTCTFEALQLITHSGFGRRSQEMREKNRQFGQSYCI